MPKEEKQQTQTNQTEAQKEPVVYVGEPILNEKMFLRPGQIFTEIPLYIVDEKLKEKFIPLSKYNKN